VIIIKNHVLNKWLDEVEFESEILNKQNTYGKNNFGSKNFTSGIDN